MSYGPTACTAPPIALRVGRNKSTQLTCIIFIETLQWVKGWVDRYGGWQNIQNYAASYASPLLSTLVLILAGVAEPSLPDVRAKTAQCVA